MKKLILTATTVMTGVLALAFIAPAAASGAVRAVAPNLHVQVGGLSVLSSSVSQGSSQNISAKGPATATGSSTSNAGSASSSSGTAGSANAGLFAISVNDSVHQLATGGNENCGRFGNGFHGGKHLFVCPNRPFPPPVSH